MAITPTILAPGGIVQAVTEATSIMEVPQGLILTAYNVPSEQIRVPQGLVFAATHDPAIIRVPSAIVFAAVRGRISNPQMRSWTFDLDGHEFYVLTLGDGKTLVLDLVTETWSWWASDDVEYWRTAIGTNWTQSGSVSSNYGSNVVVGDGTTADLWVLNPEQGYDDPSSAVEREAGEIDPFTRTATAQMLTRNRDFVPCWQVFLFADAGEPAYEGATVELLYSDDQGRSTVSAGTITVETGNYGQDFQWGSLGQIGNPGRLFFIKDNGAFKRINELTMPSSNDD